MPEVGLQVVPEFFQAKSGGGMAVRDEECDHLPEDSHLTPAIRCPRDDAANDLHEERGVHLAIHHESRERFAASSAR